MQTTLRTFEAPSIEAALARVREEVGPSARIIRAERIRSGGLAGFFSKEHYELTAEIIDPLDCDPTAGSEPSRANSDAGATPVDLLSLADTVSELESRQLDFDLPERPGPEHPAVLEPPTPSPSTEGAEFASVLRRIAGEAGLTVPRRAPEPTHAGVMAEPRLEPRALATDDTFWAITGAMDRTGAVRTPIPTYDDIAAASTAAARTVSPLGHPPLDFEGGMTVEVSASTSTVPAPISGGGHTLARLGVPAGLLALDDLAVIDASPDGGIDEAALIPALISALRSLPAAPTLPSGAGSIIATVGERHAAVALARRVAGELGLDADGVIVAARESGPRLMPELRIGGPNEAAERAEAWRGSPRPTLVAVAAAPGSTDLAWARRVIEALGATVVLGAAEASRKPEDLAAWADAIGRIDALSVSGLAGTVSPAAVLALGLPVSDIDGREATPMAWALTLTERLAHSRRA